MPVTRLEAKNDRDKANPPGLEFLYAYVNESFDQRDSMNRTPADVAQAEHLGLTFIALPK